MTNDEGNSNDGADSCHSERSKAESRNPVAMFSGNSTGSFDFAQDDGTFLSFVLRHSFVIRHSDFVIRSSFHISNRRESRNRLADPCQLGRRNYLVNVLVSATCFLGETRP